MQLSIFRKLAAIGGLRPVLLPSIPFIAAILSFPVSLSATTKVAVVYERQGKAADIGALIEVQLTGTKDVALVERAQIDQVLKEQTLQAALAADGVGNRVMLGKLLQADVLVLLSSPRPDEKKKEKARLEVVVCETHGGLRLAAQTLPLAAEGEGTIKAARVLVAGAVARSTEPIRTIVAVPPLMCNDVSFTYQHLGAAYARLIEQDLLNRKGTLVVELAEAQALAKELAVGNRAGVVRQLPLYVMGEYRNNGTGDQRRVNLCLRLKRGDKEIVIQKQDNISPPQAGQVLTTMATKLLNTQGYVAKDKPNPEMEVKELFARAKQFEQFVQPDDVLPLYEASLLLKEQQEGHGGAAKAILDKFKIALESPINSSIDSQVERKDVLLLEMKPLILVGLAHAESYVRLAPCQKNNAKLLHQYLTLLSARPDEVMEEAVRTYIRVLELKARNNVHDETFGWCGEFQSCMPTQQKRREYVVRMASFVQTDEERRTLALLLDGISTFLIEPAFDPNTKRLVFSGGTDNDNKTEQLATLVAVSKCDNPIAAKLARRMYVEMGGEDDTVNDLSPDLPLASDRIRYPDKLPLSPAIQVVHPDIQAVLLKPTQELSEVLGLNYGKGDGVDLMKAGDKYDLLFRTDGEMEAGTRRIWIARSPHDIRFAGEYLVEELQWRSKPCWDGRYLWGAAVNERESDLIVTDPATMKQWHIDSKSGLPADPIRRFVAAPLGAGKICAAANIGTEANLRTWVAIIHFDPRDGARAKVVHEVRKLLTKNAAESVFKPHCAEVVQQPIKSGSETADRQIVGFYSEVMYDEHTDNEYWVKFEVLGDRAKFISMSYNWRSPDRIEGYELDYDYDAKNMLVRDNPRNPWHKLRISIVEGGEPLHSITSSNHFGFICKGEENQWLQLQDGDGNVLNEMTLARLIKSSALAPLRPPRRVPLKKVKQDATSAPAVPTAKVVLPSSFTASVFSPRQINLSWPDDPMDHTGFEIQRATDTSFTRAVFTMRVPPRATMCIDTGLEPGTTYYYRLRPADAPPNTAPMQTTEATTPAALSHNAGKQCLRIPVIWGIEGWMTQELDELTDVVAVSGGSGHILALRQNGTVVAWGEDYNDDDDAMSCQLRQVPRGLTDVIAVAAGYRTHNLALKRDGTVVSWGLSIEKPPQGLCNVVAIAAENHRSLALRRDGTVVAWGGPDAASFIKETQTAKLSGIVAIDVDDEQGMGIRLDGTVVVWGGNAKNTPPLPSGLSNVMAVACGTGHFFALRRDGTIVAWGRNRFGPATVPAGLCNVIAISLDGGHCMALKKDGTVVEWGDKEHKTRQIPLGLSNVVAITDTYSRRLVICEKPVASDNTRELAVGKYVMPIPKGFNLICSSPTAACCRSAYGNDWLAFCVLNRKTPGVEATIRQQLNPERMSGAKIVDVSIGDKKLRRFIVSFSNREYSLLYLGDDADEVILISGNLTRSGQVIAVDKAVARLRRVGSPTTQPTPSAVKALIPQTAGFERSGI